MNAIRTALQQFIVGSFMFGREDNHLTDEDSLMEKGIIDSTGIMELVFFLEREYHIEVEDNDLLQANLDSINGIEGFVQRKLSVGAREGAPAS